MATQFRRRYGFLLRSQRADAKVYQFPDVNKMSSEEIDKEIKLRFESLQRRGVIPRSPSENDKIKQGTQVVSPPANEPLIKKEVVVKGRYKDFTPKVVIKRS